MLINSSDEASIYSAAEMDSRLFPVLLGSGATALSLVSIISIYSHAKIVTKSKQHRKHPKKPKLYFQFWALHISAIGFLGYTLYLNLGNVVDPHWRIRLYSIIPVILVSIIISLFSLWFDVETPTSCCRCCCLSGKKSYRLMIIFHCFMLIFAVFFLTAATGFLLLVIPSIILHYYINPLKTLIRLQLLASAAIYTNSLLALLIFQCERCLFPLAEYSKLDIAKGKKYCRYSFWTGLCSCCGTQLPKKTDKCRQSCINCCKNICVRYSQPQESAPYIARVANHDKYYASFF